MPALLADRALDHLHVPVAPLLDALVDVDHPLADLRRAGVAAVHLDQAVLHAAARGRRARPRPRDRSARGTTVVQARPLHRRGDPVAARARRMVGEHPRVAPAEHGLELAELRRLEAARALEPAAEARERERRHRLEDVDLGDDRLQDRQDPLHRRERRGGVAGLERPLQIRRLVQQHLEPELVDLVDDDEEQLVVLGPVRQRLLAREELVQVQVGRVGERRVLHGRPHDSG